MAGSEVYFTDFHLEPTDNFLEKFERLVKKAGIAKIDFEKKFTAIKIHFGEYGNVAYLRPGYARTVASIVKELGGMPFVADCSTLYAGNRKNALEHLDTAAANGYTAQTLGCNVIIGDGLKGDDDVEIPIDGDLIKSAKIGRAFADADVIVTISHFKCHEMAGIGGAIKNMAMGCASRRGKMAQHNNGKPSLMKDLCRGCGRCVKMCGSEAISITDGKAAIDRDRCVGCGLCIPACHFDAIYADYDSSIEDMCKKMAEYAHAAILGKPNFHISIISDVMPYCDCRSASELPIVPNIGVLASFDPVALDKACADLVNAQMPIPGSKADVGTEGDNITRANPQVKWELTLEHAVKMGMGTEEYELIKID